MTDSTGSGSDPQGGGSTAVIAEDAEGGNFGNYARLALSRFDAKVAKDANNFQESRNNDRQYGER
ncbi:MAG: hypothetical protein HKN33_08690 [Pyrinomonadaceae bacterium]|nr:hypothetical protein [Pyrinomonadaceae bacterium]